MSPTHDSNDAAVSTDVTQRPRGENGPSSALPAATQHESRSSLSTLLASETAQPTPAENSAHAAEAGTRGSLQIGASELDALVDLVGELVLARNQLLQTALAARDNSASETTQRLDVVTSDLQEGLMRMRTQPIGAAWSSLVECARRCGARTHKRFALRTEGFELELDRSSLEGLRAPLGELIELVVERSLEATDARAGAGKSQDALLELAAGHDGGRVVLELRDDGAGLSEDDAQVREALERIRAQVGHWGASLTIGRVGALNLARVSIPLTLAITPALLVSAAGERFAIPQTSLVELVRITRGEGPQIENFGGGSLFRLREALLPVVELRRALALPSDAQGGDETVGLVVVQVGARRYGLVVDTIHDTEEIVVKPLAPGLAALGLYSGATILGDGSVALILDASGLARSAGLDVSEFAGASSAAAQREETAGERERWLVFELPGARRMAAPLSRVSRLEEFPVNALERSCDDRVVQYRGAILPLLETAQLLGANAAQASAPGATVSVVVLNVAGQPVGLVAERVLDILDCELQSRVERPRPGILCAAVLGGAVTDVLDVDWIASQSGMRGDPLAAQNAEAQTPQEQAAVRQLCTFRIGKLNLAADVDSVQEILRTPRLKRVPRAAAGADALINLRGQTVLTLDLAVRLSVGRDSGAEAAPGEHGAMTVVFRTRQGPLAARVDSVGDVLEIDPTQLAPVPTHGDSALLATVRELYRLPDSLLLVLDPERLLGEARPASH